MTSDVTLEISGRDWETPVTGWERQVGRARLHPTKYARGGYYQMHGVRGGQYYKVVDGTMPVTELQRRHRSTWRTWMVDDPLHWFGMGEKVEDLPPGEVLVAGLGLGLMLHHMAARADLTRIVVVEVDEDVVQLVRPTLPDDPRVEIVVDDFYHHIETLETPPDSVLWDLAVGEGDSLGVRADFLRARVLVGRHLPGVPLFMFGTVARGPVPVVSVPV